jgi:hypothetical protein
MAAFALDLIMTARRLGTCVIILILHCNKRDSLIPNRLVNFNAWWSHTWVTTQQELRPGFKYSSQSNASTIHIPQDES